METNFVPSTVKTAITPDHVYVNTSVPRLMALIGTLGKAEFEGIAAIFLAESKEQGKWVAAEYPLSAVGRSNTMRQMIEEGLLLETKDADVWRYELSEFAISRIYVAQSQQTIHTLKTMLEEEKSKTRLERFQSAIKQFAFGFKS